MIELRWVKGKDAMKNRCNLLCWRGLKAFVEISGEGRLGNGCVLVLRAWRGGRLHNQQRNHHR